MSHSKSCNFLQYYGITSWISSYRKTGYSNTGSDVRPGGDTVIVGVVAVPVPVGTQAPISLYAISPVISWNGGNKTR